MGNSDVRALILNSSSARLPTLTWRNIVLRAGALYWLWKPGSCLALYRRIQIEDVSKKEEMLVSKGDELTWGWWKQHNGLFHCSAIIHSCFIFPVVPSEARGICETLCLTTASVSYRPSVAPRKAAICTQDNTNRINTQISVLLVRFEPTAPVFERTKTVHALNLLATVIDSQNINAILSKITNAV
jgi:hypothetical protein